MNAKGRTGDLQPSSAQVDPRDGTEREETQSREEEKDMGEMNILSQSKVNQNQVCGYDNYVVEEATPGRTTYRQELDDQNRLTENHTERTDESQRHDISSRSREGARGREVYTVSFPKEETLIQGQFLSSCSAEGRKMLFPSLCRIAAEDSGSVKGGALTPSKIAGNCIDEKHLSPRGTEDGRVEKDTYTPCSKCKAKEAIRLLPPAKYPNYQEPSIQPSQEEICTQSSYNEDDYDYIEEFLGEGTLVSIDSAQTYVDLQNGAVRTSIEVSAEDEGVAVKHEVDWVTQFVRPAKAK